MPSRTDAPLRGELASREPHDRALPRAVRAEEGDPLPALDDEVELFEEGLLGVLVGVAHVLHLEHRRAPPARCPPRSSFMFLLAPLGVLDLLHPVEELLLAPGLAGLPRLRPVLLDKALELRPALGVRLGLAGELLFAGLFLLYVLTVVAGVAGEPAAFELQDRARYGVEEVAVVGDDEHGGLRALDEVLQPLDGLEVEVVGRLVEQDEVGLLEQETGQGYAALLPARERPDGALPVLRGEAQAEERVEAARAR